MGYDALLRWKLAQLVEGAGSQTKVHALLPTYLGAVSYTCAARTTGEMNGQGLRLRFRLGHGRLRFQAMTWRRRPTRMRMGTSPQDTNADRTAAKTDCAASRLTPSRTRPQAMSALPLAV